MKKTNNKQEMLPEYDFSKGIRGKYAKRYSEGSNIVVIDPDVHEFFPDQKSVNEALRGLATVQLRRRHKRRSTPMDRDNGHRKRP